MSLTTRSNHSHVNHNSIQRYAQPAGPKFSKAELLGSTLAYVLRLVPRMFSAVCPQFLFSWFHWCPTSAQKLEIAEQRILENLSKPYVSQFVNIGKCCADNDSFVRTVCLNKNSENTPLVLLHGFACGIGVWIMNLDSLSESRPLYVIDVLGFGRSSRPPFGTESLECELQFFISLEKWRSALGLEKFILLGHSMGGYIASSYALHYPERVALLVLIDPWGLPEKPITTLHHYDVNSWVKFTDSFLRGFNFLAGVRAAGPLGPYLVKHFRNDLLKKYGRFLNEPQCIMDYVYHCNTQTPSGEAAFKVMTDEHGWAKNPMMYRLISLDSTVPITFVYGSRSWVNRQPGLQIKYSRLNSSVDVRVIEGAGHHAYADKPEQFNLLINEICDKLDQGLLQILNK